MPDKGILKDREGVEEVITVDYLKLRQYTVSLLQKVGLPPKDADIVADALLYSDAKGVGTHGVRLLSRFMKRLQAGGINTRPNITVTEKTPVCLAMDGDHGFGQLVAYRAMERAIETADTWGMGLVVVNKSNHIGGLGYYPKMASEKKMIGFITQNTMPNTVPTGGVKSTIGNNPFAVSIPRDAGPDFILDMAISKVARTGFELAAQKGKKVDPSLGVDAEGNPTDDPQKVLDGGGLVPIGGHKGVGLSIVMDVLSAIMSGSLYGNHVVRMYDFSRPYRNLGHFVAVLKPTVFMSWDEFQERLEDHLAFVKSSYPAGSGQARLHGEQAEQRITASIKGGVSIEEKTIEELSAIGAGLGLQPLGGR